MSLVENLLSRLSTSYRVEPAEGSALLITHGRSGALVPPIRLELEENLLEEHLAHLARHEQGDVSSALGLVQVHIEEMIESSSASGSVLRSLGLRRRVGRRPEWFVDRSAVAPPFRDDRTDLAWGP